MDSVVHPVCQIEGGRITPDHCQQLQKSFQSSDCFGCGSPYRLCARCRILLVAFPEIEFCYDCMEIELRDERGVSEGEQKNICSRCQVREIRYPQYNLCLCCTVSEYAPEKIVLSDLTIPETLSIDRRAHMSLTVTADMYQRAVEYTKRVGGITANALVKEFSIGLPLAREVVNEMEKKGIVGPQKGRWPRELLAPNGHALTRVVAPSSLNRRVEQEASLTPSDRALLAIGMELLREKLNELSDKLGQ